MIKTKIVCTMGPVSRNEEVLRRMIGEGMNVARLNFSHGDHVYHRETIELIKRVRAEMGVPLAILLDTKGPEIRLKNFEGGEATLEEGKLFTLTMREVEGNEKIVSLTYGKLIGQLSAGDIVLIDDGKIRLEVEERTETDAVCRVLAGGKISDHKGVNVPSIHLEMPYLSEQDRKDVLFGIENDVDFIAASFVRRRDDVVALRKFIDYNGGHQIRIISKIENAEGIENFDDILENSDGIMVASGDMGVEVEYYRLPGLQKRFIKKCYQAGKMVITATQMLESMTTASNPTRAEITDVANAVFDGTSALMLSGETAMGKYPVQAVSVMAKIAEQAESDMFEIGGFDNTSYDLDVTNRTNAVSDAACTMAKDLSAKAINALTKFGETARKMSKFRPSEPVVAATPEQKTFHQLALSWSVYPVMAKYQSTSDALFQHAIDCAKQIDMVEDGDTVVIAAGIPLDMSGNTNILKVETVGGYGR